MNTIRRRSDESSVTIPFERTFRNLDVNRPLTDSADELEFNFCGCGWPQHMLIPKGKPEGFPCELFAMVSDYQKDYVSPVLSNKAPPGICQSLINMLKETLLSGEHSPLPGRVCFYIVLR